MIEVEFIKQWRLLFPWLYRYLVEQDLVLSKAIVLIFKDKYLSDRIAMLGGTAIYKLIFKIPIRYSEDIDLKLKKSLSKNEIYQVVSKLKTILEPWLGKANIRTGNRISMTFKFTSSDSDPMPLKLKLDIDTVETFSVLEYNETQFEVSSGYFSGKAIVNTLQLEECIAKKLRALGDTRRVKGRDLLDIWYALVSGKLNVSVMLKCFYTYMEKSGKDYSREHYERILADRLKNQNFRDDTEELLHEDVEFDIDKAGQEIKERIISNLPSRHH